VFTARQVVIRVAPEPEHMSLSGGILAPRIGAYFLLQPGEYRLEASKRCYRPLQEVIRITQDKSQTYHLKMEKLPGRLNIQVHERDRAGIPIPGARLRVDGKDVGSTPLDTLEMGAGTHRLHISAPRYQDQETQVDIRGCGEVQSLSIALAPGWGDVHIQSVPAGAEILVEEKSSGRSPTTLELLPGDYLLELRAPRHKTWRKRVTVKADQALTIGPVELAPADSRLLVGSNPPGASVTIDDKYMGNTPLETFLAPGRTYGVRISKAGYERAVREVTLSLAKGTQISVDLVPVKGVVRFKVDPADAELLVNGKSRGKVPEEIQLLAVPHRVMIQREGYAPFEATITPQPGFPKELQVALKTKAQAREAGTPAGIRAPNGYAMTLVRPGTIVPKTFEMGASRREQGRRSNETLRKVALERPFFMGTREVTNKEFREFQSQHRSGVFARYSLDRDELPVVQVTWEEAARFCNWLSQREGLAPVYRSQGDRMVAADPLGTGYRLPTEAEWEYCARFSGTAWLRYPWGDSFPPTAKSGNYADLSDKDLLPLYLMNYNDGYPVTAPPGAFAPNALGLYDMGGNVAEWCHDYYTIYSYSPDKIYQDPTGPARGEHHVVKGSGWKDASIMELRLSYRDYSKGKRPDLGFRICRYAQEAGDAR